MVKLRDILLSLTLGFSPLLILFMVKFFKRERERFAGFSPLLILFMVK